MPGLGPFGHVVQADREATAFTPALVHPQQHLGEVLGVDAAVLGVDLHDAVAVVVLAGEQAAQLELVERRADRGDRVVDVRLLRLVVLVAGELVQHLDVADPRGQVVERREVVTDVGVLGVELLRPLLVVPQPGFGDLGLEDREALAVVVDRQIARRLVEATLHVADVLGEVTHDRGRGGRAVQVAPWHCLNFLPDPHGHGALRGVFEKSSLTTVCCFVGLLRPAAPPAGSSPSATAARAARSKPPVSSSSDELVCRFCTAGASAGGCSGVVLDDLHVHHVLHEVLGDAGHHGAEHLEAFALPLDERILLAHRPQVDAALEVVHLLEVLTPALVDDAQHHLTLDLAQYVGTEFLLATLVVRRRIGHDEVVDLVGVVAVGELLLADRVRPVQRQLGGEAVEIPFVARRRRAVRLDERVDRFGEVLHRRGTQVLAVEDLIAALVDDLALLVHHLVVLEDVLADLRVLRLDGGLRPFDRLGDHLRLDRLVVGQRPAHHVAQRTGGEQAHQVVVEAEEEPALAGVTLTAGAAAQLVVDATAVVAFRTDDVEATEFADLVALGLALRRVLGEQLLVAGERLLAPLLEVFGHLVERHRELVVVDEQLGVVALLEHVGAGQTLGVAAELDVDTTTGHVRGHGDRGRGARPG